MKMFAGVLLLALAAFAAGIDGKWKVETKTKKGQTITTTIDLKAEGDKLTGSVTRAAKRERTTPIENGKLEGNKFSFTTTEKSRKTDAVKITWEGTVEGDQLNGTHTAEGRKRGTSFVAKRN